MIGVTYVADRHICVSESLLTTRYVVATTGADHLYTTGPFFSTRYCVAIYTATSTSVERAVVISTSSGCPSVVEMT